jgi:radical SAM superfamily enzyme with C-terminal helix-hairpin-helix motif
VRISSSSSSGNNVSDTIVFCWCSVLSEVVLRYVKVIVDKENTLYVVTCRSGLSAFRLVRHSCGLSYRIPVSALNSG